LKLLAALDDSAATAPLVAVARWLGDLAGLDVVAMHVSKDGSGTTARATTDAAGIRLTIYEGDPAHQISAAATDPDVRMVAVGARGLPMHATPAGHVALDVIRRATKPIVVVPPDAKVPIDGRRLRLIAPIDDEPASAAALRNLLEELQGADVELDLVLLRVFDAQHMPMFANHETYEAEAWGKEFVAATTPLHVAQARVETRVGTPAHTILSVEHELECDLVALACAGDFSHGRAAVVKRLLAHATTPLVLLPCRGALRGQV
jgi:hypothetical protein